MFDMRQMRKVRAAMAAAVLGAAAVGMAQDVAFVSGKALKVVRDGEEAFSLEPAYWGEGWRFVGFKQRARNENGVSVIEADAEHGGAQIRYLARIRHDGKRRLEAEWELSADRDTKTTHGIIGLAPGGAVKRTLVTDSNGAAREIIGGYGRNGLGKSVSSVAFFADGAGEALATLRFSPAAEIASDGAARIILASGDLKADSPKKIKIAVELPRDAAFYPAAADAPTAHGADWYEWKAKGFSEGKSILAMDDWLDKPAGRLGRITAKGDKLMYGGKPIRLWGLNICYAACAPEKALAEKRARFYARYGVNAVRLHKYADGAGWAGIQGRDSFATFDPEGLDRMDYFIAKLKERGIFTKLSAHFGTPKLGAGDKAAVPYLEEFGKLSGAPGARVEIPASGVYYSREIQDAQIAHYVNLLKHRNPYTGLTYAEDPALAFVEILNEQSALFWTSMGPLKASATLRRSVGKRFCDWLRAKYKNHAGLVAAWGEAAFNSFGAEGFATSGERLEADNILPIGNPWFWDPDNLHTTQKFRRQRLLDTMMFLKFLQDDFNSRFVKAMRAAGYAGEIIGSNWQAGRAYSHFANLHSDALVGVVDRHNYFGGMDATMLDAPGSGLLSSGLQQVAGRPFMLSEWIHTFPSAYAAEGPAIIGAYGMGLQGWDASFMFQNRDDGGFSGALGRDAWDVTQPQIMGLFPAVARQVLRGDVRESAAAAPRRVDMESIAAGKLGFDDRVAQKGDAKEFSGALAPEALAAVRCVVEYSAQAKETPKLDLAKYESGAAQRVVASSTGELRWGVARDGAKRAGFFTMDAAGAAALVGFMDPASGMRVVKTSNALISAQGSFAAIYINAAEPGASMENAKSLLVTMIGRAANTGMKSIGGTLIEKGAGPILMEPVRADITLKRKNFAVWALDHDGVRTGEKVPVKPDGSFTLDGRKYKTPYFEVAFGG